MPWLAATLDTTTSWPTMSSCHRTHPGGVWPYRTTRQPTSSTRPMGWRSLGRVAPDKPPQTLRRRRLHRPDHRHRSPSSLVLTRLQIFLPLVRHLLVLIEPIAGTITRTGSTRMSTSRSAPPREGLAPATSWIKAAGVGHDGARRAVSHGDAAKGTASSERAAELDGVASDHAGADGLDHVDDRQTSGCGGRRCERRGAGGADDATAGRLTTRREGLRPRVDAASAWAGISGEPIRCGGISCPRLPAPPCELARSSRVARLGAAARSRVGGDQGRERFESRAQPGMAGCSDRSATVSRRARGLTSSRTAAARDRRIAPFGRKPRDASLLEARNEHRRQVRGRPRAREENAATAEREARGRRREGCASPWARGERSASDQ